MVLDIRFTDKAPSQYQGVRMTTVYTLPVCSSGPELVIHFYDYERPMLNIKLDYIVSITTSND